MNNSFKDIPKVFIYKWQEIANLLAKIMKIPAALIMKTENEFMEVYISSLSENNPFHVGDKEHWHGLYCEAVIKSQKELLIPNATIDKNWDKNPDIKSGMIAYLGFPINFPDKHPFGTLCVLDNKENHFLSEHEQLLLHFKNVIELDLAFSQSIDIKTNDFKNVIDHLLNKNKELHDAKEKVETSEQITKEYLTELKKSLQSLKESEEKYRLLSENVTDGVSLFEDNKVKYVSEGYLKMFGYEKQEIENISFQDIFSFIHNEDKIKIKETIENAHKNQVKEFSYNYRVKAKNGEYFWLEDVINAEFDSFGNHFRSVVHSRDITERKQAELIIQQQNNELNELNATKDKFFSIIAHDLKNPFNSIMGFSELLVEQVKENDYGQIVEFANIILRSSHRAMNLLRNLMQWAQVQSGRMEFNPEYFDMVAFINNITLLFDDIAAQKSITIKNILPHNASIFGDNAMISTVLRNLISNAIKFTMPGGEIIVSAMEKQNEVIFSVSDSGVGISKNIIEKLFRIAESHSTLGTNKETGTGLGLILCKEFVEKHNGKIWVESEEGKGSIFYFTLPCKY